MLIEALLTTVVGLVQGLVDGVLPSSAGLPFSIPTGLLTGYTWLDSMAPLHEMVAVATVLLAIEIALFGLGLVLTIRHTVLP